MGAIPYNNQRGLKGDPSFSFLTFGSGHSFWLLIKCNNKSKFVEKHKKLEQRTKTKKRMVSVLYNRWVAVRKGEREKMSLPSGVHIINTPAVPHESLWVAWAWKYTLQLND